MASQELLKTVSREENVAIVFGVTGLVGREIAKRLLPRPEWRKVYGLARNPEVLPIQNPKYHFVSCDLLNPSETRRKLSRFHDVTHAFWVTWSGRFPLDTEECCEQNKEMMSNAINAVLEASKGFKHFSLQTGMKHYVSMSDLQIPKEVKCYDETCPRASSGVNFYYTLEDFLEERLSGKVAWSVHRPGLLKGFSNRSEYNFIGALCVYGSLCKHLNLPFVFGGSKRCWEECYIDGSDARLVAEQHIWAATSAELSPLSCGEAFNAINGQNFTWKEIWPVIGKKLGAQVPTDMFREDFWFQKEMANKEEVWKEIVMAEGLAHMEIQDLANWVFLDVLFRLPIKLLGTRAKADRFGFRVKFKTSDSILYWIDVMRDASILRRGKWQATHSAKPLLTHACPDL